MRRKKNNSETFVEVKIKSCLDSVVLLFLKLKSELDFIQFEKNHKNVKTKKKLKKDGE